MQIREADGQRIRLRILLGQRDAEQRARLAVIGERILLVVDLDGLVERQKRHLVYGHHFGSMSSAARRLSRAPRSALSIITSARCSVTRFSSVVLSRMRSR